MNWMKSCIAILLLAAAITTRVYIIDESPNALVIRTNFHDDVSSGMESVYFPDTGDYYQLGLDSRKTFVIDNPPLGEQLVRVHFDNGEEKRDVYRYVDVY
jgi:hypothetical protein